MTQTQPSAPPYPFPPASKNGLFFTVLFSILTILAAIPYWILMALGSMGGPLPDYAIAVLLCPAILLHSLLIRRNPVVPKFWNTFAYAGVVLALCLARYWEIAGARGFGEFHANTSLAAYLICAAAFATGFLAFLPFSPTMKRTGFPVSIMWAVAIWLLLLAFMGSYLHTYRRISLIAISSGNYAAKTASTFVVCHDGVFGPGWRVVFKGGGSRWGDVVCYAPLFGPARGGKEVPRNTDRKSNPDDLPQAQEIFSRQLVLNWNAGMTTLDFGPGVGKLHFTATRMGRDASNTMKKFEWEANMRAVGFTMAKLPDENGRIAPMAGYVPNCRVGFSPGEKAWSTEAKSSYAILTGGGAYGLINITVYGDGDDGGVCGRVTVYLNKSGARNLDHR